MTGHSTQPIFLALLKAVSLVAGSCSAQDRLPEGALHEIELQWSAISPGGTAAPHVSRAWRSQRPADQLTPWAPSMETWCVELKRSPSEVEAGGPGSVIWIVTRVDKQSAWSAAPLMIMSSTWPYEACEVVP